jgi:hypothetical protein
MKSRKHNLANIRVMDRHSRSSETSTRIARLYVIVVAFALLQGSKATASAVAIHDDEERYYLHRYSDTYFGSLARNRRAGEVKQFDNVSAEFVAENLTSDPQIAEPAS